MKGGKETKMEKNSSVLEVQKLGFNWNVYENFQEEHKVGKATEEWKSACIFPLYNVRKIRMNLQITEKL